MQPKVSNFACSFVLDVKFQPYVSGKILSFGEINALREDGAYLPRKKYQPNVPEIHGSRHRLDLHFLFCSPASSKAKLIFGTSESEF